MVEITYNFRFDNVRSTFDRVGTKLTRYWKDINDAGLSNADRKEARDNFIRLVDEMAKYAEDLSVEWARYSAHVIQVDATDKAFEDRVTELERLRDRIVG